MALDGVEEKSFAEQKALVSGTFSSRGSRIFHKMAGFRARYVAIRVADLAGQRHLSERGLPGMS
ncbi:MAG TPA: hypothetical protein VF070_13885 [Streptosporangiaceae bacterium]